MTLEQLTNPLTADQIKASIYAGLASSGVTTTDWKPGAATRTIIAVVAVVLAAFSELIAEIARMGFLELSSGDWLDLVAFYVYGVGRQEDTFATGFVTLTNAGVAVFNDVAAGDLVVRHAGTGRTYRSTAVFSLAGYSGSGPMPTAVVPVQADEAGSASNAIAGTITEFVTTFIGVTVTNAAALAGSDRELDPALKARCRAKTGVLSPNGPRDAYTFLALSAVRDDGTSIGVTRVRTIADGVGGVDVYVADEDGTITGTVGDEDTDLGIVDRDIQEQAAPLAITARLHSATPLSIAVTYSALCLNTSGFTAAELEEKIEAALLAFMARAPIGGWVILPAVGKVYVSAIRAAIAAAPLTSTTVLQPYLVALDVTLPAVDVELAVDEAPVLGTVSGSVVQVPGGSL